MAAAATAAPLEGAEAMHEVEHIHKCVGHRDACPTASCFVRGDKTALMIRPTTPEERACSVDPCGGWCAPLGSMGCGLTCGTFCQ